METCNNKVIDSASTSPVVGRLAPTPSGRMHLGNVFSSLMAWLAVRSTQGRLILRIEDLDPRSHDPHASSKLIADLAWLELEWDVGPVYQHDRLDRYEIALKSLRDIGLTYPCFCTRAELHAASAPHATDGSYLYQGTCRSLTASTIAELSKTRSPAIRVAVPDAGTCDGIIYFTDEVYGPYREELAHDCGDFLVRRSDGIFAYQLAVVVDDTEMGVTQVVRGRDLLSSAPRQMWLASCLGQTAPSFAHIPLLIAKDGRRLSKRNRDLDVGALRAQGFEAQEIIGALAHAVGLAKHHEKVSPDKLIERFSWDNLRAHRDDIVVDSDFLA